MSIQSSDEWKECYGHVTSLVKFALETNENQMISIESNLKQVS